MQIVSEAVYERLKEKPLAYATTHNKIVYITRSELVVRHLELQNRAAFIKLKNAEVLSLALEKTQYFALLYAGGHLEVRRLDRPSELVMSVEDVLSGSGRVQMRITGEAVYLVSGRHLERIGIGRGEGRWKMQLQEGGKEQAMDILISGLLEQEKVFIIQFQSFLSLWIGGVPVVKLDFQKIDQTVLLSDPLLANSREYLAIIAMGRWLRVYDLFELRQICEVELFAGKGERVGLRCDPFNEYGLVRIWDPQKGGVRNSLLKVNRQAYKRALGPQQPFFMFNIEVGLHEDLLLFPTHPEMIMGTKFDSIDMVFFKNQEIHLATLIVETLFRNKIHHATRQRPEWMPVLHWTQILSFVQSEPSSNARQIEPESRQNEQQDLLIAKLISDNQVLKGQICVEKGEKKQKYLDYSFPRVPRDKNENEDALNTLSGSSSFRSLGSFNQQRILKMLEEEICSIEGEEIEKMKLEVKQSMEEQDEQDETIFGDEHRIVRYLSVAEEQLLKAFDETEDQLVDIARRIGRFEQVHLPKLKKVARSIREERREAIKFEEIVKKQCEVCLSELKRGISQKLHGFTSTLGKLQLIGVRYFKQMKKKLRDFSGQEVEVRQERLEVSEESGQKIDYLMGSMDAP